MLLLQILKLTSFDSLLTRKKNKNITLHFLTFTLSLLTHTYHGINQSFSEGLFYFLSAAADMLSQTNPLHSTSLLIHLLLLPLLLCRDSSDTSLCLYVKSQIIYVNLTNVFSLYFNIFRVIPVVWSWTWLLVFLPLLSFCAIFFFLFLSFYTISQIYIQPCFLTYLITIVSLTVF